MAYRCCDGCTSAVPRFKVYEGPLICEGCGKEFPDDWKANDHFLKTGHNQFIHKEAAQNE